MHTPGPTRSWASGWVAHRAHVQRDAVAAIERGGGLVAYDWHYPDGKYRRDAKPPGPRWLAAAIGPDFLGHPRTVGVGPRDTERVMAHVGQLKRIHSLVLVRGATLSDADMVHLKGMPDLTMLNLNVSETAVTDAGLKSLAGLKNLEFLKVSKTGVTDAGVDSLREVIPKLRVTR